MAVLAHAKQDEIEGQGIFQDCFIGLCRRFGAGLFVSEMITARPLVEGAAKARKLADFGPGESPRSLQLYGVDPHYVGEGVRRLVGEGRIDHLDLKLDDANLWLGSVQVNVLVTPEFEVFGRA